MVYTVAMKKLLILSAVGLFGSFMFLLGLFGGIYRDQFVLVALVISFLIFLIPFIGALILAIDENAFGPDEKPVPKEAPKKATKPLKKVDAPQTSKILNRIIMRDKIAQSRYTAMHEQDSHIHIKQEDFDRFYLIRLVNELVDSLLKRPTPN